MGKCRWCERKVGLDMLGICGNCRSKILRETERSRRLREDLNFTAAKPVRPSKGDGRAD
jgi:hypothetical protein